MRIYLQNTLTGNKEEFKPLKAGFVSMYNCGPTVYNYAHIGNLRSYVFADTLRRVFEYNSLEVKQVINITDIGHLSSDSDDGEDKMTKALKREGKPLTLEAMKEVANFYFDKFKEDLDSLNIETPANFPFASDHIKEDIDLVTKLEEKGFTYAISDGIYFDISKFPDYGRLGNIKIDDKGESRVGSNPEKRNQRDFAVWKFNSELGYNAPFGKGFPGWHIECSAMSVKYLGPEFDVHTGGIDHIPVHHNNEIAQSVCAGDPYAKYWLHNAFLNVDSGKMAKSDGNDTTLKTLMDKNIDPVAYRYLLLTARYSSPLQFSWEALEGSLTALKKLRNFTAAKDDDTPDDFSKLEEYKTNFLQFVNDDLDTPKALALVWDMVKDDSLSSKSKKLLLIDFDKVLGLNLNKVETVEIPENVKKLIKNRDLAREGKDFVKSDELRVEIETFGFEVKDTDAGTLVTPR
ncbi:MAG: cysteine--tRNA ligase [Candidatus Zambryskibacteria bacterium]|nr:cysteine--tRNA ligase [Candidatus Zambryskibacteria bacterium]